MVHPTRRSLAGALPLAAAGLALPMVGRAAAAEFTYKFGVDLPTAHPTSVWAQKAADTIRERTGGRLEIRVFSNGALGSSTEMTSQLRSGALEFLSQSGPVLLREAGEDLITVKLHLQSQPWHMYSGVVVRCIIAASTWTAARLRQRR